jgi:uncharacterized protein involved in exopolysaccharide biosynthesis
MTRESSIRNQSDGEPREQYERIVLFLRRALRFWPTFASVLVLGAIACAVFMVLRKPAYRSETVMLYTESIRPVDATDPTAIGGPRDAAVRLREMLLSRPRLLATVEKFNLYPDVVAEYGPIDAAEELREDIDFRAPGGDTFSIGFKGDSREQARAVTEYLASSLIEDESKLRLDRARQHRQFLRQEREKTNEALKKAERNVAQFLADHPQLALDAMLLMPGAPSTGAAIRAGSAPAPSPAPGPVRYRAVAGPSPAASPAAAPAAISPDQRREIAAAKTRAEADLTAAEAALSDKRARFTDLHPDVRALKARVERERARVNAATVALTALREPLAPAAAPAARPSAPVVRHVRVQTDPKQPAAEPKNQKNELVELETDWARLTRDAAEARGKNEQVEASLFKAELAAKSEHDGGGAHMVVLDPAFLPARPVPPGRLTIAGIFLALALLLATAVVAGRAAIDDRVYAAKDLAAFGAVLAEVPPLAKSAGGT